MEMSVEVHGIALVGACPEDNILPKVIHNREVIGEINCGKIGENIGKFLILQYLVVKGVYKQFDVLSALNVRFQSADNKISILSNISPLQHSWISGNICLSSFRI